MVCPPSRGLVSYLVSQLVFLLVSQLVSQLAFLLVSLCGGWSDFAFCSNSVLFSKVSVRLSVGWCVRLPEVLSPILSPSLSLFSFPFVAGGLIFEKHVLNPPTVWGLRWCNLALHAVIRHTKFPMDSQWMRWSALVESKERPQRALESTEATNGV